MIWLMSLLLLTNFTGINSPFKRPWLTITKSDGERILERLDRAMDILEKAQEHILSLQGEEVGDDDSTASDSGDELDLEHA